MHPQSSYYRNAAFFVCGLVVLAGCGPAGPPASTDPQATVTGSVVNGGKPITLDSTVVFYCEDKGATASAKIDSLGNYTLAAADPRLGIPAGRYKIMVRPPEPPAPKVGTPEYNDQMMGKAKKAAPPTDIPEKYLTLQSSTFVLEIKAGPNTFPIDFAKLP